MFSRIIGNESVKEVLLRYLAAGRVPNALLFSGTDGVGKRLFALELARAFLCRDLKNTTPCGQCPVCLRAGHFEFPKSDDKDAHKKVIFSNHADVGSAIPYNRNILVDAIRDLEKEAYFRPYEGRARFFLIDDADKMNDAASNALLKTLEEPASTSHIILITSRPDALLPTIRSRCQTVRFAPVETEKIEHFLINKRKLSSADAKLNARLAFGSVGRALSIELEKMQPQREMLLRVLQDAIENHDRVSLLQAAEKLNDAKNKDNFEENLEMLLTLIRDVWSLALGGEREKIINIDRHSELARLAENAETRHLALWMDEIERLRESFAVNVNKKIATDALFVGMTA
ncbi:MAG: DNA polymerase III subunit delta' [Pyrinomonadaceae bacterium]